MLQSYAEFQPTGFDARGAFLDDDRQSWLVAPVSQTRDSECLSRSNFTEAEKAFEEIDADSHDHETHRFGHWGPGWFEIILVRPTSPCHALALELAESLADYPVLDEEAFSELEYDEAHETIPHLTPCLRDDLPEDYVHQIWEYLWDASMDVTPGGICGNNIEEACASLGFTE